MKHAYKTTQVISLAFIVAAVLTAGTACTSTKRTGSTASGETPRLYRGFGNYQRDITTNSRDAQAWFNQAMQLLYGFNHDEAIRSFEQAASFDPQSPMPWWGIAYAHGLHINNPLMTEAQSEKAWKATQQALARVNYGNAVEQALVRAVSSRYQWPAPSDRKPLDEAYAAAMKKVWQQFPNDPDVGALYAESMMNLQPWDLWTRDGQPKGRTLEIVQTLERALELDPQHPGANHFYVHAMEASVEPEKALPSADRLTKLVPGSGHLIHMPAHIYARLGRWGDASKSNENAIKVDRAYFKIAPTPDFYSLYFVHNIHFLAWSSMMEGRYQTALNAARELERDIPADFLKNWPQFADGFMPVTYHVMIRFGKWDDILSEPEPPAFRHISRAMRHYARGVALSAQSHVDRAADELKLFEKEAALIPADWMVGQNKAHDVIEVARHMLRGELAYREGQREEAYAALRKGVELEDALKYDEPPGWMQPVRHALGALLMGDSPSRASEAESVYRADLALYRNNGWSLLGLQQALLAQDKTAQVDEVKRQLAAAWKRADSKPTSSCYCQPAAR